MFLKLPYKGNFRLLHNFVHVVHLDKPEIFLYYIFSQPQPEIFLYYIFSQPLPGPAFRQTAHVEVEVEAQLFMLEFS